MHTLQCTALAVTKAKGGERDETKDMAIVVSGVDDRM